MHSLESEDMVSAALEERRTGILPYALVVGDMLSPTEEVERLVEMCEAVAVVAWCQHRAAAEKRGTRVVTVAGNSYASSAEVKRLAAPVAEPVLAGGKYEEGQLVVVQIVAGDDAAVAAEVEKIRCMNCKQGRLHVG